jgi:hypothetical protein
MGGSIAGLSGRRPMNEDTRREFLSKTIPGVVLGGVGLTALPHPVAAEAPRQWTAGFFAIELDGQLAGFIDSVEGGGIAADKMHFGPVGPGDIIVECGIGMSRSFYDWIKATLEKRVDRRIGAIVAYDSDFKPIARVHWLNAHITEVGFPACDVSSKDVAKMTIKITPQAMNLVSLRRTHRTVSQQATTIRCITRGGCRHTST